MVYGMSLLMAEVLQQCLGAACTRVEVSVMFAQTSCDVDNVMFAQTSCDADNVAVDELNMTVHSFAFGFKHSFWAHSTGFAGFGGHD